MGIQTSRLVDGGFSKDLNIYIYIYMYVCMYIYIYVYVCICVCMMYVCMYVPTCTRHMCTYSSAYIGKPCMYAYLTGCMYAYLTGKIGQPEKPERPQPQAKSPKP